jgi:hypothetical protein
MPYFKRGLIVKNQDFSINEISRSAIRFNLLDITHMYLKLIFKKILIMIRMRQ